MIKILLADDHKIVREGIISLLNAEKDFSVVGEASDGLMVLQLVEKLRPDVLITDLIMPGISGLEITRQISKLSPAVNILILSMHSDESYVLEALRNGAAGYILKNSGLSELSHAVRTIHHGHRYLDRALSDKAIEVYMQKAKENAFDMYETLTTREREVLCLAAAGMSNAGISKRLCISPNTAMTHRSNMMRKLDLHSQTELVQYAVKRGILTL